MSHSAHRAAVTDRLAALADKHATAEQTLAYVRAGRERAQRPSTEALLTTLRLDDALAYEVVDNMGRDVMCALVDADGVVRYPLWSHTTPDAVAPGETMRTRSYQRHASAKATIDGRRPRVLLRDGTPLHDLDEPASWDNVDGPGQVRGGP